MTELLGNEIGMQTGSVAPQTFRVFLGSPGDVPLERKLVREAITRIGSERRFRGRIYIEIIAWDQPGAAVAMEAGLTPQEAIAQGLPKPEDCDLAVIIFWSRIGTQLPPNFEVRDDGTPYLSGTEWEYVNALNSFKANRKPAVWVYRRTVTPQFAADDPKLAKKVDQWGKVERFFEAFTNPDGSLAGGINHYGSPDDFRQQFENHLRDRLDRLLETIPNCALQDENESKAPPPSWRDSPYPGLAALVPEQAPIFFGRGAEVDQLLAQFANPKVRFVAVVGVSGSGKSSLVLAGLLPRLRAGIVGAAPWIDLCLKPGERGGDPFLALAHSIKSELPITGKTEQEIARACLIDFKLVANYLAKILARHDPANELLLVVDQFEELFTQVAPDKAKTFLALIDCLSKEPQLRVIVTLRADFYARAIEEAGLARLLRRDGGTFPLDPPGIAALHEMIVRPAEAAGVELQDGLVQRLLDEAGTGPGAMALVAFTLSELYERSPEPFLTVASYDAYGGVQGAVEQRAETALQGLPVKIDLALAALFVHLVEVNEQETATRRRAPQTALQGDAKVVAAALTEARLLVCGEGQDQQPTLEVAHETVLNGWTRLCDWISAHAESLRARRDLERVAGEWYKSGRHRGALRGGVLLHRYLGAAEPRSATAEEYLRACKGRLARIRIGYALVAAMAAIALGVFFHLSKSAYPPSLAARALLVQVGLWPVSKPEMVVIPKGEFVMGSLEGEGKFDEHPSHVVRFEKEFELGKYEVTFNEYDLFAAATGRDKPSDQWGQEFRGDRPVIYVSWDDAVAYADWLSMKTGLQYRLPTEAEWEYAVRAKSATKRYWTENAKGEEDAACAYANVFDRKNAARLKATYAITWGSFNCEDEHPFTAPVGRFTANAWQLHDMLGNVWEWVQDCYFDSYNGAQVDGSSREVTGAGECKMRVLRGGSWNGAPGSVRSAKRRAYGSLGGRYGIGFRLAKTL